MITARRIRTGEGELYRLLRIRALKEAPYAFASTYASALIRTPASWEEQADRSAQGSDRATFLLFNGVSPVGLTALYRSPHDRDAGEMFQVWVAPASRKKGAATQLLGASLDWARENGIRTVVATVAKGNERAHRFYLRHGFHPAPEVRPHRPDDLVLLLKLERDEPQCSPEDLLQDIVEAETLFPQTFAKMEQRDWGILFLTPAIPDSHDGNHAAILHRQGDLGPIVDEIQAFYEERDLVPRINYVSAHGDDLKLRAACLDRGFTIGFENTMAMAQFHGPSRIAANPKIKVELVDDVDSDMLATLAAMDSLRMAQVIQRRARHRDGQLFLGRIREEAATVALLERVGRICRVDEVHTAEALRRQGGARAVMNALVSFYEDHLAIPLYLWTDSRAAGRIYEDAGFKGLDHPFVNWSAWREKS